MLPVPFQSRTGVKSGGNLGSDAFKNVKNIYRLLTLKVQILWLVAGNLKINQGIDLDISCYLSLKKDFSE